MYSWVGRLIQPLQKRALFGFEYLGVSDPSQFSVEHIEKNETLLRVSRARMGAEIVPYVPSLYSVKNPPKQIGVSSRMLLSSTSGILCSDLVLTDLEILLQDDVNVYRSMPLMPDLQCPDHMMPSTFRVPKTSRPIIDPVSGEKDEVTDDDRTLAEVIKRKRTRTSQESMSSFGGDFPSHSKKPRVASQKRILVEINASVTSDFRHCKGQIHHKGSFVTNTCMPV
jgi:hypothetical protein